MCRPTRRRQAHYTHATVDASLQKEGYCFSKDYLFLAKKGLVLIVLPAQERKKVLTRMDVEFGVNRAKVSANRVLRYDQAIGNPVRRTALSEQFEHLELTIGKAVSLDKVLLRQWHSSRLRHAMRQAKKNLAQQRLLAVLQPRALRAN